MKLSIFIPLALLLAPRLDAAERPLYLHGGTLIDGTGALPRPNPGILISEGRFAAVGGIASVPAEADRLDAAGKWIVPGLIDLHGHFTAQRGTDAGRYRESETAAAIRGVEKLGRYLDGGITTVRDLGTAGDVSEKLKEAVERRIFPGPRIFWCRRRIVTRGGHGDERTSAGSGRPTEPDPRSRVANGAWEWREAVREQIRMGADVIKLTSPYTREEVAAAVDEAHLHGFRVTADAFGEFVAWAVEAGIDAIEHPLAIDDETISLMARKKTALVPTLTAFYNPLTHGYPSVGIPAGGFFFTMARRFHLTHQTNLETVRKAHAAGVTLGVGTDIPVENEKRYPADYFTELAFLKDAGLTNAEVLTAATRAGAEILGLGEKLGTLTPGKLADVLVVAGDPLADVQNLQRMRLVIADGIVVRDRLSAADDPSSKER
jgi:imidazolonepropionase-like amidohydrolase